MAMALASVASRVPDCIVGLREQIIDNAITLFPAVVRLHRNNVATKMRPDSEAFSVIIVASRNSDRNHDYGHMSYQAKVNWPDAHGNDIVAASAVREDTVEGALRTLLDLLAVALWGDGRKTCHREIDRTYGLGYEFGEVNRSLTG
ncbi:hypothetical protein LTR08_000868 [Meristemomyces frigidus]|nr:hypothetical protein LTR08_000868 [Meristemomyces frigidus]